MAIDARSGSCAGVAPSVRIADEAADPAAV